jgi:hemerythrin superfamily protein
MDVLDLIKRDHAEVKSLFDQFQALGQGNEAQRGGVAEKILEQLPAHDHSEEKAVYSPTRERVDDDADRAKVAEAFEEHEAAGKLVKELKSLSPSDKNFTAKMNELIAAVRKHIEDEEGNVHPLVRECFDDAEREKMGKQFEEGKQRELARSA